MFESCGYFIFIFISIVILLKLVRKNNIPNNFVNLCNRELYKIKECFKLTKRVTCSRNSNKLYKKRRRSRQYRLILREYDYNHIYYPILKSCIYLISIISEPEMFYERNVFRKIYKKYNYVSFVFVMGKSNISSINAEIIKEIIIHRDILQFHFLSSYFSLILQTYNILLYTLQIHTHFNWLIKHDTDTFFNINSLYILHNNNYFNNSHYIWGYILNNFPSGMGYVIPFERIRALVKASNIDINQDCYGPAEDVYIGKLARRCNISLFDIRKLNKSIGEGSCLINTVQKYIMIHRLKPLEIYFLHTLIYN